VASVWRATLPDGTALLVRRVQTSDAPRLAEGFAGLSEESRRQRFLAPKPTLSASELRYFTEVDGHHHEALAAIDPATGIGVGIARFVREPGDPTRAEVAVTVADEWQHRGVATLLLGRLTDRAREEGIERYTALISADNRPMRQLLAHLGAPVRISGRGGSAAEYEVALVQHGLGEQLVAALRSSAIGYLSPPPALLRLLRSLVPVRFTGRRADPAVTPDPAVTTDPAVTPDAGVAPDPAVTPDPELR
jgi:RimJ/RimL family protein N-acetyltransferase